MIDELAQSIRERRTILFAGAGLSMSVGLPSWNELIKRMADELGLDPNPRFGPAISHYTLAEYYRIVQGSIGPLRSWMDRNWKVSEEKVRASMLHETIVALDFPIIYTTNYDRNIEAAFQAHGRDFVKVANVRDIAKTRDGVTQIVKFHGDFDDDQSLVLTETDYFNRLSFDSPLDFKFRSDALGKTILFIGYSMSDLNIRLLLHRLWRIWENSGYEKDRPKSYVFMAQPNPVQEAVLGQWGLTTIAGDDADPEKALTDFLTGLRDRAAELETDAGTEPARLGRKPSRRAAARR